MSEPGWFAAVTVCRVCSYRDVSVFPAGTDADNLECSRCHQMTSDATEYINPDGSRTQVEEQ